MNTKNKLKIIGTPLFLVGLILVLIGPVLLGEPMHTGMSVSERSKVELRNEKNTYLIMLISGISLGAGLALVITGSALKEKEIHNKENAEDGLQPPQF